jgi:hypothetical protein
MSDGKACGKQAAQYTGKQPGEGCVVTSADTAEPERGAFVRPHAQKVNAPRRNVFYQAGWGKGGNREIQAACCTEEEDAHHEARYADSIIAVRR